MRAAAARRAVAAGLLIGAVLLAGGCGDDGNGDNPGFEPELPDGVEYGPVTLAELAAADGQDGRPCLVAVDGTVYLIDDFLLWRDGEHVPSEGQAYCGADLSEVIQDSPHGTQKLELLIEIGPLEG